MNKNKGYNIQKIKPQSKLNNTIKKYPPLLQPQISTNMQNVHEYIRILPHHKNKLCQVTKISFAQPSFKYFTNQQLYSQKSKVSKSKFTRKFESKSNTLEFIQSWTKILRKVAKQYQSSYIYSRQNYTLQTLQNLKRQHKYKNQATSDSNINHINQTQLDELNNFFFFFFFQRNIHSMENRKIFPMINHIETYHIIAQHIQVLLLLLYHSQKSIPIYATQTYFCLSCLTHPKLQQSERTFLLQTQS
eukprot:TRINITY_DN17457_c0_g3_i1.p1 TRINITY_DN17457_c0_g3~~TRINITY_DN17457_c0_g3_i1.p1  ORF type:complete len:246 (+),score=-16.11 TRINITY_DN17457_c0_g3_i1:366-1103(+)